MTRRLPFLLCFLALPVHGKKDSVLLLGSPSRPVEDALRRGLAARKIHLATPVAYGAADDSIHRKREAIVRQATATLARVKELFYEVQAKRALALLPPEIERAGTPLALTGRLDLLRALHLWQGVCLVKTGEPKAARRSFAAAILIDEDPPPDDTRFPPEVVEAFASEKDRISRREKGKLVLQLKPRTARVTIDGKARRPGGLSYGDHWVVVEALGYIQAARKIKIEKGETRLTLTLYPAPRGLIIRQLEALSARGLLDPTRPDVARVLGQIQGARETLLVQEETRTKRLLLTLTRIRCVDGRRLGGYREAVAPAQVEAAVQRALGALWRPDIRKTPVWRRWWFWTTVGAVVVGGTVAAVVAATAGPSSYKIKFQ